MFGEINRGTARPFILYSGATTVAGFILIALRSEKTESAVLVHHQQALTPRQALVVPRLKLGLGAERSIKVSSRREQSVPQRTPVAPQDHNLVLMHPMKYE